MDNRKWEADAIASPPTAPASPSDGYPTNGNPLAAQNATEPGEWWFHAVGEELRAVIVEGGLTPDLSTLTQLRDAIKNMVKGGDYKDSVRVASTANVAAISGLLTIDGVTVVAGDRVLLKDQSTASQNGIYVAAAGAWPRASDADTGAEFNGGAIIPVEEGTENADTNWQITNNGTVTIGTTGLTFAKVGSSVDATETAKGVAEIATQAEVDAGADDTRFVTPLKLAIATSRGLGYGQTWQDVTASRAFATTYTNTTGKPIEVQIQGSLGAGSIYSVTIDGVIRNRFGAPAINGQAPMCFVVPNNSTYSAAITAGSGSLALWNELR